MAEWKTSQMQQDGHAEWLTKTGENIVYAMRQYGGLPSLSTDGFLAVEVPTLVDQARTLNKPRETPPGALMPTAIVDFLD